MTIRKMECDQVVKMFMKEGMVNTSKLSPEEARCMHDLLVKRFSRNYRFWTREFWFPGEVITINAKKQTVAIRFERIVGWEITDESKEENVVIDAVTRTFNRIRGYVKEISEEAVIKYGFFWYMNRSTFEALRNAPGDAREMSESFQTPGMMFGHPVVFVEDEEEPESRGKCFAHINAQTMCIRLFEFPHGVPKTKES